MRWSLPCDEPREVRLLLGDLSVIAGALLTRLPLACTRSGVQPQTNTGAVLGRVGAAAASSREAFVYSRPEQNRLAAENAAARCVAHVAGARARPLF